MKMVGLDIKEIADEYNWDGLWISMKMFLLTVVDNVCMADQENVVGHFDRAKTRQTNIKNHIR